MSRKQQRGVETKIKYQAIIGLEIHTQLKTKSKMFCGCSAEIWNEPPNSHVCPVCLGLPGALPAANEEAVKKAIMVGIALNCQPQSNSKFDRKNYFYPDLPKGYQISQYDLPFSKNGYVAIANKKIRINRAHLEEDTGKLLHAKDGTLIDFNRSGIPLMEIVSEPDVRSASEAKAYGQKIQQIMRYLNVSGADIEKGNMRLEPNISLRKHNTTEIPGYKVEVKNIGSLRSLERAIEYEISRQAEELIMGKKVVQETRGWNEAKQRTVSQRTKEFAHDYRYFPEPDLTQFLLDGKFIAQIKNQIPELPNQRLARFKKQYKLLEYDSSILTSDKETADFFEEAAKSYVQTKISGAGVKLTPTDVKKVANVIINDLAKILNERGKKISQLDLLPAQLAELLYLQEKGEITVATAKEILLKTIDTEKSPRQLMQEEDLSQIGTSQQLEAIIIKVIKANKQAVADYKKGKNQSLLFLVGQVMKETKGKANPLLAKTLIEKNLGLGS